jgi:RNA polymerase sigma-70 factor (ECF subfamily)
MTDEERRWITQARRGDDEAFALIVERYQRPVFNLCYRMLGNPTEAEDAAQESFIRVYTRLSTYDEERKFSSWILSIASHYCIDRLRRRKFQMVSWEEIPSWTWPSDPDPQPEEVVLTRDKERQVQALLETLPPEYKAALVLRYWQGYSYEEIAQTLNASVSAVKSRLFRARRMMAEAASQTEETQVGNLCAV